MPKQDSGQTTGASPELNPRTVKDSLASFVISLASW